MTHGKTGRKPPPQQARIAFLETGVPRQRSERMAFDQRKARLTERDDGYQIQFADSE